MGGRSQVRGYSRKSFAARNPLIVRMLIGLVVAMVAVALLGAP